jgi:hypothetical protein
MPGLLTNLKLHATIEREVYQLFSQTINGSDTIAAPVTRTNPFYVAVTISDWATDGSVIVTGLLSGLTVTSTIAFTGNERRVDTSQQFDTLISVATFGFGGGTPSYIGDPLGFILAGSGSDTGDVRVDAVSRTGQAKEELVIIATNAMCKVSRERFGGLQQSVGEASIDAARIYFFPWQVVKKKDIVSVDGDRWRVKGVQEMFRLSDGMPYYKLAVVFSEDQS